MQMTIMVRELSGNFKLFEFKNCFFARQARRIEGCLFIPGILNRVLFHLGSK